MGARHVDYGVQNEDYDKVADAFLWTLQQGLGEAFTPEVKEAWVITYTTVASVMIEGANAVAASVVSFSNTPNSRRRWKNSSASM